MSFAPVWMATRPQEVMEFMTGEVASDAIESTNLDS